jgi:hypothetical protein
MGSTLLDRTPRRAEETRAPTVPGSDPWRGPPRLKREPGGAFIAAILLHAAVLVILIRFEVPHMAMRALTRSNEPTEEVYPIVVVGEPSAPDAAQETPRPTPAARPRPVQTPRAAPEAATPQIVTPTEVPRVIPVPVPGPPTAPPNDGGRPGASGAPSIADRVGPRMGNNPNLWVNPPTPGDPPLTPDEAVRARVAGRLSAFNDSMRLAAAAAEKAVDWTVKDKNGGRWGVSPKGIHLGGITLPLPIQFSAPPGRRDDVNAAVRNWSEIQAQRANAEVDESIQDRIKAIRARKEAERREKAKVAGSR